MRLLERAATEVAVEVVCPFRAIPGKAGALAGFDYALPLDPLDETLADGIARLRALYRARHAPLAIEFNESVWAGLGGALEQAGFLLESRNPLMACGPEDFRARVAPDVSVAFERVDPKHPERMRVTGALNGATAGRAALGASGGVAELYGVVTEPAFRRRGVAAMLCSALMRWHFERGGTLVFLDAENAGAERLYQGLGFTAIGARLCYRDPSIA